MQGRVKFHRKITEREWYSDANPFRVFFHLITIANHKDWKRQGIDVKRWQTITSIDSLAEQIWLTSQKVRTAMDKLISTWEIAKKTTNRNTIVTVLKYCDYNDYDWEDNKQITSQITNKQQTDNKQITTNKNDKNEKENIINSLDFLSDEVKDIFITFIDIRKKREKWLSDIAIKNLHANLHKLSQDWPTQIAIINNSITNNWKWLFQLREELKKYTKTEYLQIESERERDKAWATAKYWDAVIKKAIAVYNENN